MITPEQFLEAVLPPLAKDEWYVHAAQKSYGGFVQTACKTVHELYACAQEANEEGENAYFALASTYQNGLVDRESVAVTGGVHRTKATIRAFRSLWVDLDCGTGKAYESQDAARADLLRFFQETGLNASFLVNSGHGLHVYWSFAQPYFISDEIATAYLRDKGMAITVEAWRILRAMHGVSLRDDLAAKFYAICRAHKLKLDTAAMDITRVLRVPGTANVKDPNKPVYCVIECASPYADKGINQGKFERQCDTLIQSENITIKPVQAPAHSAFDQSFAAQEIRKFEDRRPLTGFDQVLTGCEQIRDMGAAPEPAWHKAVCVCLLFEDGATKAHELSQTDPRYTAQETDAYVARNMGLPVHCQTFDTLRPGICTRCSHKGEFKSPVQLCYRKEIPKLDSNIFPDNQIVSTPYQPISATDFFCDAQGVWKGQVDDKGNQLQPLHISCARVEFLYVGMNLEHHTEGKAEAFFLTYAPKATYGIIRKFPLADLSDLKAIASWCDENGLTNNDNSIKFKQSMMALFMNSYINRMMASQGVTRGRYSSYGWLEIGGELQFILDEYKISKSGFTPTMPVQEKLSVKDYPFTHKGDLNEWLQVPRLYRELRQPLGQLAICMAFAAPFMVYSESEAKNCVLNIYSMEGGRGKSHLLRACASVYGNPQKTFLQHSSSNVAMQRIVATYKNLPVFIDEIGNKPDDDIASLIFFLIGGQEKQKLDRSSNIKQTGSWNTVVFTTANKPLRDIMSTVMPNTDAGILRVLDCECTFTAPVMGGQEATLINNCFATLENNYGLAGPAFIKDVLNDIMWLQRLYSTAERFVVNNKFESNERFYSFSLGIALAVGRKAVNLGYLDYDIDDLEQWILNVLVPTNRSVHKQLIIDPENEFNEFINANLRRTCLIVAKHERDDAIQQMQVTAMGIVDPYVIQYPVTTLEMRYEVENKSLFFSQKSFSTWCSHNHFQPRVMLKKLKELGIIEVTTVLKNLAACVPRFAITKVKCYTLTADYVNKLDLPIDTTIGSYVPDNMLLNAERVQIQDLQNLTAN